MAKSGTLTSYTGVNFRRIVRNGKFLEFEENEYDANEAPGWKYPYYAISRENYKYLNLARAITFTLGMVAFAFTAYHIRDSRLSYLLLVGALGWGTLLGLVLTKTEVWYLKLRWRFKDKYIDAMEGMAGIPRSQRSHGRYKDGSDSFAYTSILTQTPPTTNFGTKK